MTTSRQTTRNDPAHGTNTPSRVEIQSSSFDLSNYPNAAVQISQYSNSDKDLYITYISSLSTQGNSSSVTEHPDSGIGESSSEPEVLSHQVERGCVVPDSQSLPGSSTYIPSTSTTSDDSVARQTPHLSEAQRSISSSDNTHPRDNSSGTGLPNESPVAFEDSIDDSSILEVAASQPSPLSLRSRSEPPASSTESWSSPSRSQGPSLVRSKSDFAASYHDKVQGHEGSVIRQSRRAHNRSQRLGKSSLVPRIQSRQEPSFRVDRHTSSEAQVPHLTVPESQPSSKVDEVPCHHKSIFQTQVPFVAASRGTRKSTESAGTFKHISLISKEPPSVDIPS